MPRSPGSDTAGDVSDLTTKRNQATRHEIVEVAIPLFIEHGFDATSMGDIAAAAGVSRRTAYRHFDSKDDIVFEYPARWFDVLKGVLSSRGPSEATRDLIRRAHFEIARFIQADPKPVLDAFGVVMATPALSIKHAKSDAEWIETYVGLILADTGAGQTDVLVAVTASRALIGATNGLIAVWAAQQPDADLVPMTVMVMDRVDALWPESCRAAPKPT